ncbi:MAG: lysophospholipase [Candidatus Hydrogenedentota bacterium]
MTDNANETIPLAGTFTAPDGAAFWERRWEPADDAKAHLVLIHGYGEHCSRYDHVARAMNGAGIAVHAYDQRGFGRSPGKRGYVRDIEELIADLDAFVAHVQPRFEGKPVFYMGHSMGGQVLAYHYITRKPAVRGLVFSSPFLAFTGDVPKALLAVSGVVGALLPWMPVDKLKLGAISRDPAVVQAAEADPLSYHGFIRARTGAQFKRAIEYIHANVSAIDAPFLALHGTCDQLVGPAGTQALYENAPAADKTLEIVDGGYHELWNDLEKARIIRLMIDWITTRCD